MSEIKVNWRRSAVERRIPSSSIHHFVPPDSSLSGKSDKGKGDLVLE